MSEESVTRLTKYIFKAPNWSILIVASLLFSLIFIPLFEEPLAAVVLIGIPAVLSSFFTVPIASFYGRITLNRSSILSFLSTISICIFLIFSYLVSMKTQKWDVLSGYTLALGFVFGVRLLLLLATVKNDVLKMVFPASLQTLFSAFFLLFFTRELFHYINLGVFSTIFATSAFLFIKYMDAPLKKSLGISGMDLLRSFINHLNENSAEMEEIFEKIGEPVDIPVTVIAFRKAKVDGDEKWKKIKALFVIPMVHPGPLGTIGSADLPYMLSKRIEGFVIVPHGVAHHDFDLVSKKEVGKIVKTAKDSIPSINFNNYATSSLRFGEKDVKILGQRFADSVMLTFTTSPLPYEDAEFAVGITAMAEAKAEGARCAAIIDAHNCGTRGARNIALGSKLSSDIIKGVKKTTKSLLKEEASHLKVGTAARRWYFGGDGLEDVKIVVIEVLGKKTAYVLMNGNNMVVELREKIIKGLKESIAGLEIEEVEVMTTDSHVGNKKEAYNYIGMKMDHEEIINMICEIAHEAISDLEPVEVGIETRVAENVFVFGSHTTAKLISTVNAITAMGGFLAISVAIAAISLSILAFLLL